MSSKLEEARERLHYVRLHHACTDEEMEQAARDFAAAEAAAEDGQAYEVRVTIPRSNRETYMDIVKGTRAEAEDALWGMLEEMGVETSIVRVKEVGDE